MTTSGRSRYGAAAASRASGSACFTNALTRSRNAPTSRRVSCSCTAAASADARSLVDGLAEGEIMGESYSERDSTGAAHTRILIAQLLPGIDVDLLIAGLEAERATGGP